MKTRIAWLLAVTVSGAAFGAQLPLDDDALNEKDFPAAVAAIHTGMQPGGPYAGLKPEQRQLVEEALEKIADHLNSGAPESIQDARQEQSRVNGILATVSAPKDDSDKKICRRERPLGSNIPQTVCYRQSELDARSSKARNEIDRHQRSR